MSPGTTPKQQLTRKAIMDVARDLFVTKGYQHVSMRQIAMKLNMSHGAIYYHFKNKAELFTALVEDHFQMLDRELDRIMAESGEPYQKMKKVMLGFIEFGLNHQSHYEIMFLTKDEEVLQSINQGPSQSYERFAQAVSHLYSNKITIQEIWSLFLSLHGFITHYLRHVRSFDEVKELAGSHVEMLLKAIK